MGSGERKPVNAETRSYTTKATQKNKRSWTSWVTLTWIELALVNNDRRRLLDECPDPGCSGDGKSYYLENCRRRRLSIWDYLPECLGGTPPLTVSDRDEDRKQRVLNARKKTKMEDDRRGGCPSHIPLSL